MFKLKKALILLTAVCFVFCCFSSAMADVSSIWILGAYPSEPAGVMDVFFQATDSSNSFIIPEKEKISFRVDNSIGLDNVIQVTASEGVSYIFVVDCSSCTYQSSNDYVASALSSCVSNMRSQDNAYFITMDNQSFEAHGYLTCEQARDYAGKIKFAEKKSNQTLQYIHAPLWDGIHAAGVQAAQNNDAAKAVKVVLIFTDGVDNTKGKTADQVLSGFGNCKTTPVYAFITAQSATGTVGDLIRKGQDGLTRLKNQNGGKVFSGSSVSDGNKDASLATNEIQSILCATVDIVPLFEGADQEYKLDLIYEGERKVSASTSVQINRSAIPSPTPAPVLKNPEVMFTWDELLEQPADLNTIQTKLINAYYLAEKTGEVDNQTKQAIFEFCDANGLLKTNEGISRQAWEAINSGNYQVKSTPVPQAAITRNPEIIFSLDDGFENNSQTIYKVQSKLNELYYLSTEDLKREGFTIGIDTWTALNAFCEDNELDTSMGFTRKAYDLLFSGSAKPARTPEPTVEIEITPTPVPTLMPGLVLQLNAPANNEGTTIKVQNRLETLGYLTGNYAHGVYDANTHQAVLKFCGKNKVQDSDDGLLQEAYDLLISDKALPMVEEKATPTPAPTAHPFAPDMMDPMIADYQNKLNELGYYEGKPFTLGKFDEATQIAQDRFCEVNGIKKQQGATVELQQTVTGAKARPNEQRPLLERVRRGLTDRTEIVGILIPVWALAAVIAVLVIAAIVIIIILIKSRKGKTSSDLPLSSGSGANILPGSADLSGSLEETVDMSGLDGSLEMTVVGDSRNITLRIDYNGTSLDKAYELSEGIPLTIGRGTEADIRTNKDDMRISRKHGKLRYKNGSVYYSDMSKAGTMVDGRMIHEEEVEIHNGSTLHISNHVIKVQM